MASIFQKGLFLEACVTQFPPCRSEKPEKLRWDRGCDSEKNPMFTRGWEPGLSTS